MEKNQDTLIPHFSSNFKSSQVQQHLLKSIISTFHRPLHILFTTVIFIWFKIQVQVIHLPKETAHEIDEVSIVRHAEMELENIMKSLIAISHHICIM
ncbi:Fatty acid synthase subunit beta [Dirofilaria immitis]